LSINQIPRCLIEIMITSWKEIKINYEDQFKNYQILKDKIKKKTKKNLIKRKGIGRWNSFTKEKEKKRAQLNRLIFKPLDPNPCLTWI